MESNISKIAISSFILMGLLLIYYFLPLAVIDDIGQNINSDIRTVSYVGSAVIHINSWETDSSVSDKYFVSEYSDQDYRRPENTETPYGVTDPVEISEVDENQDPDNIDEKDVCDGDLEILNISTDDVHDTSVGEVGLGIDPLPGIYGSNELTGKCDVPDIYSYDFVYMDVEGSDHSTKIYRLWDDFTATIAEHTDR